MTVFSPQSWDELKRAVNTCQAAPKWKEWISKVGHTVYNRRWFADTNSLAVTHCMILWANIFLGGSSVRGRQAWIFIRVWYRGHVDKLSERTKSFLPTASNMTTHKLTPKSKEHILCSTFCNLKYLYIHISFSEYEVPRIYISFILPSIVVLIYSSGES